MRPSDTFTLERMTFTDISTIGDLRIDGDIFCKMLELSCRKANIDGKLAIPSGTYELFINKDITTEKEKKFGFTIIQVLNVPGRKNIEIHPGNYPLTDTEGCILPGNRAGVDVVYDSRAPFFKIKDEAIKRLQFGKLYLRIIGGR